MISPGPVPRHHRQFCCVKWRGAPWTGRTRIALIAYIAHMHRDIRLVLSRAGRNRGSHVVLGFVNLIKVAHARQQKIMKCRVSCTNIFVLTVCQMEGI